MFIAASPCQCFLTSDSSSVLLPSVCSLENSASGDTCPAIPSEQEWEEQDILIYLFQINVPPAQLGESACSYL